MVAQTTSNRIAALCEEPEVLVRDGCRTVMQYDERWHRTQREAFPRHELIPHPECDSVMFDVCVTYDAAADELEANVCSFRLKRDVRAPQFKGSVPFNQGIERQVERRAILNV